MINEVNSINQLLNETIGNIPKEFKKYDRLKYISKQSFQQLALVRFFNSNNNVFANKIIPNEVMSEYISYNALSKRKKRLENNQEDFSDDFEDENAQLEEVYQKIENIYGIKNCLIQFDSLSPFDECQTKIIQDYIISFRKKLLQNSNHFNKKAFSETQDQQEIKQDLEEPAYDEKELNINAHNKLGDIHNQQDNKSELINEKQQEITQYFQNGNENLVTNEMKFEDENQQEIDQDSEEQTFKESEQTFKESEQNQQKKESKLINESQCETEFEIKEDNNQEIKQNLQDEDIPEKDINIVDQKQQEIKRDSEEQNFKENEQNNIDIQNQLEDNQNQQKNDPDFINERKSEINFESEKDNQKEIKQEDEQTNQQETNQKHRSDASFKSNQSIADQPSIISKITDKRQKNDEDKHLTSLNASKLEEEERDREIFIENHQNDKYQFIIQNIACFFRSLYNIGYGHFISIAKKLGIERQKEEISFYACTAAVIIIFRLLPEKDKYAQYQNILLTLSNLYARFNINMIRNTNQNDQESNNIKEKKKIAKYNSFVKSTIDQAIAIFEPYFIKYLKETDVTDFLNVLEVRCSYDNWALFNRFEGKVEFPFDLLKPSKFSQFDSEIYTCLTEHKEFPEKVKIRINDFTYLFTYLNIIDGPDKRIIVDAWTKPEIEKIKTALLNFGTASISSLDFIAKTCIITKSFRSISNFINKIVNLTYEEPENEIDLTVVFDDATLKEISFNTNIYESLKKIVSLKKNKDFDESEIEFMKLIVRNGIKYFDEISLDSRYSFKNKSRLLESFDAFVNSIVSKNE